jgi:DNA-binding transcriptional regulator YhcF (GntR family)
LARNGTSSKKRGKTELALKRNSGVPLYLQIARALATAIRSGQLRDGGRLPSTRVLAEELGVSRNTVVQGYEELKAMNVIQSRQGARPRVGENPVASAHRISVQLLLRNAAYPVRSAECHDPDGMGLRLFTTVARRQTTRPHK